MFTKIFVTLLFIYFGLMSILGVTEIIHVSIKEMIFNCSFMVLSGVNILLIKYNEEWNSQSQQ